jgi:threonine/homoserine/homoserine lactone efflux protein
MQALDVLVRGAIAGLAISAPVGPVNVFCVSRTLEKGRRAGIVAGWGAAAADTIYGAIAGFSISFVIGFLIREESQIRFFGGLLLIFLGILYYFRKAAAMPPNRGSKPAHSDFVAAFFLNLANPTTVLSFLAVLTVLHLHQRRAWAQSLMLVAGIFAGAMLWWIALAFISGHFRDRFTGRGMLWMNRIAGLAIGGFGAVSMILSRTGAPK